MLAQALLLLIFCCSCTFIDYSSYEDKDPPISYPPEDWNPLSEQVTKAEREIISCFDVESCSLAIQKTFYRTWGRPPQARNGMRADFHIRLDENYEVVEIHLIRPSGYFPFDQSAAKAILSSSPYLELAGLSKDEYNLYFRNLRLVFEPIDLRK